jgi:hypothetical protein
MGVHLGAKYAAIQSEGLIVRPKAPREPKAAGVRNKVKPDVGQKMLEFD